MNKQWIKFLKDWAQNDDASFKKGDIVEIDENIANSLINLQLAEKTEKPADDSLVKGITQKFEEKMTELINSSITTAIEGLTKSFDEKVVVPATPRDHDREGLWGWDSSAEFASAVIKAGLSKDRNVDERLLKAPQGQHTQDDAEGGYLVPPTIERQIWQTAMDDYEVDFFGMAGMKRQTSGNTLQYNAQEETSRKDGYRHYGGLAYWTDEAEEFTASKIKWEKRRLELHKLTALYYATDEELADADIALAGVFDDIARKTIRWKVSQAMWQGNGVAKPLGVMNAGALITIAAEGGQTSGIRHANVRKMFHRMLPSSRGRAVWYVHPNVLPELETITFDDDTTVGYNPVYLPPGGISSRPYGVLYGRPVVPLEFCQDFETLGDIVFADMSEFVTLTKRNNNIRRASSIHVRFLYEETAFRFSYRVDAQPTYKSAVTDLNGTTTRSPYVTLATRS